jgi:hypothetical protein
MPAIHDGPVSPHFTPVILKGNVPVSDLVNAGLPEIMAAALEHVPSGACTAWGIPFEIGDVVVIQDQPVSVDITPTSARWFVFMHTSEVRPVEKNKDGFISPMRGAGQLGEHAADYVLCYADGSEARAAIRRRFQIGAYARRWGENCFEAVAQHRPFAMRGAQEQLRTDWGWTQTRNTAGDNAEWMNWLWAWENPFPEKPVTGLRFEPTAGLVIISAISAGDVSSQPLRWCERRKACLILPQDESFQPDLDDDGLLKQIRLDLGQVISADLRPFYPNDTWPDTENNQAPGMVKNEVLIEYTAHPEACFHLLGGQVISVAQVEAGQTTGPLLPVAAATQVVKLRTVAGGSGQAAHPRRMGRVPAPGRPPPHPQPGLVRGLQRRPGPLRLDAAQWDARLHLHQRRDDPQAAAGPGVHRGVQRL